MPFKIFLHLKFPLKKYHQETERYMDTSTIGILTSYAVGTLTGWFLFARTHREWIVGKTLAMLEREGVIAVEETEDGDLSVTPIPAVDTDDIVLKLIADLERLQEEAAELAATEELLNNLEDKDNEPESD